MKNILAFIIVILPFVMKSQLLYDPTVVYDAPGELYSSNQVKVFELNFYNASYHDTLTQRWFNKNEERLPAQFDFGTLHFDSVGVKYKGNSTFYIADFLNNPKVPYNIDINEYVGGQKVLGYKKLKLANVFFDPTFAKEALASHIYRNYLPTHEVALCKLIVNGNYMGVYANTESISKQFLKKHFKEKDGVFFKCEPTAQYGSGETFVPADLLWRGPDTLDYIESYERKSDSGWVEFLNFIDVLNNSPADIEQVLNVDRVLWYFAITTVIPNDDAYNTMVMHNYYLYRSNDGKFQFIPWDLSESFCGAMIGQGTHADHYERDVFYGYSPFLADHPLVYRILSNGYYQKKFLAHIRTVMDEFYDANDLKNWAIDLQTLAYADIEADNNKLFNMNKVVNNIENNVYWFTTEIAGIVETITNRKSYLINHPEIVKTPPDIINVTQSIQNPTSTDIVYIMAEVTNADLVNLKVTNNPENYASDFQAVQMVDDGTNGDAVAGDNVYTAAVPFTTSNDHIKYYIEAENADALKLEPERAEYFYYHYYVDQVVGQDDPKVNFDFSFYPNPANDYVRIQIKENVIYDLFVHDMAGRQIKFIPNQEGAIDVAVEDLNPGNYLITLISDGQKKSRKLIVK